MSQMFEERNVSMPKPQDPETSVAPKNSQGPEVERSAEADNVHRNSVDIPIPEIEQTGGVGSEPLVHEAPDVKTGPPDKPSAGDESGQGTDSAVTKEGENLQSAVPVSAEEIRSGRDTNIAGGNLTVTTIIQGFTYLHPKLVHRGSIISDEVFVASRAADPVKPGVCVVVGPRDSGRRTVGLKILDRLPPDAQVHTLPLDWDKPDVDRIPCELNSGYLIDLTDIPEALDTGFREALAEYAQRAQAAGSLLVVLSEAETWQGGATLGFSAAVTVRHHSRPDAKLVAGSRISAEEDYKARKWWLDNEPSVFARKLESDAPPARAVEFATAILKAKDEQDTDAFDSLQDWKGQIGRWFKVDAQDELKTESKNQGDVGGERQDAESRALRISAAFLNGSSARTVLESADRLLEAPALHWSPRRGGPLAAADDEHRCVRAGLSFADGTVSITNGRNGLDRALIRYLWRSRPRLVSVLTEWLAAISAPGGEAADSLGRLSQVLSEVAEVQGSDTILELVHGWLQQEGPQQEEFAVEVLDQLAVHPVLGSRVREDLRKWANRAGKPEQQRAVVAICRRRFGEQYPRQALTRLRYVLERSEKEPLRKQAIDALADLLDEEKTRLLVLNTVVDWAKPGRNAVVGRIFLDLFGSSEPKEDGILADPSRGLLGVGGDAGVAVRELFRMAWKNTWKRPELRESASHALLAWRAAVESGVLSADEAYTVVSVICEEEVSALNPDLDRVISGTDPFSTRMREGFFEMMRGQRETRGGEVDRT